MKAPVANTVGLNALLAFLVEERFGGKLEIDSGEYDAWALRQLAGGDREPSIVVGEVIEDGDAKTTVLTTLPSSEAFGL